MLSLQFEPIKIGFIDHYDSFSFNILDWLQGGHEEIEIAYAPHDDRSAIKSLRDSRMPLVFSPGPLSPSAYPESCRLMRDLLGKVPILGICLGHQMLGVELGGRVQRAQNPRHGLSRVLNIQEESMLFKGIPNFPHVAAYNSLSIDGIEQREGIRILARCEGEEIQALSCQKQEGSALAFGVQFHPESFLTEHRQMLRANWLNYVSIWRSCHIS